ncbi:cytochrome c oxidase subunit 4 [Parenemella sanctibonifatiensis]|uniref:Cytochrome c oxidase polypeptide 4 n=1 Tax=Parenemella sanctibonifatiensis TaxID=2016505 RepID=A0A255EE06_9ACTN|nr:cytochrome c oxidase subunit 4 [Parenemella sanctibonifatiensis]OYN89784.1 cytochrome C oxidase subunit IV [Parenemella sanctibonifatiensis]
MKAESWIFLFLTIYFAIVTPVYWFMAQEPAGTFALGLSGVLGAMVGLYLRFAVGRKIDVRPEDRKDGEIAEGAGELGFFPPQSIWPFWLALSMTIVFLGPIFGWWLTIVGIGMVLGAAAGWVFEFYRGDYAH